MELLRGAEQHNEKSLSFCWYQFSFSLEGMGPYLFLCVRTTKCFYLEDGVDAYQWVGWCVYVCVLGGVFT